MYSISPKLVRFKKHEKVKKHRVRRFFVANSDTKFAALEEALDALTAAGLSLDDFDIGEG